MVNRIYVPNPFPALTALPSTDPLVAGGSKILIGGGLIRGLEAKPTAGSRGITPVELGVKGHANQESGAEIPKLEFCSRDVMPGLCMLVMCLSVCLSQVGVLAEWLNESSYFLAQRLPAVYPTLFLKVSPKIAAILCGSPIFSVFPHGTSIVAGVVNLVQFIALSVHICLLHDGRDATRRAGSYLVRVLVVSDR